jgi:two-component system cell cycle response regulator DivK
MIMTDKTRNKSAKNAKNAGKTILIVEDNELNLKLFRDLLQTQGFSVIDTKDGMEAIVLAKQYKPDLILMDIQLHGVSGFDVIKKIKAEDTMKNIPIVAVTAFAMKDDKERILESGCEAYIAKPISIEPFLQVIENFIEQKEQ